MANIYAVKLLKNGQLIQQRQVHAALAESTGAIRIKAQADVVYVLSSESSKKAVTKIVSKRVGNDLQLVLDDSISGKPQLIIEDYFAPNQNSALATLGSEGELVLFSPDNAAQMQTIAEPNEVVALTAKGADTAWWSSAGVQLALIAGGLYAVSESKSKSTDNNTQQTAQNSINAYATGVAQASTPTEATYKDAGYSGVTTNNVGAINSAILRAQAKDNATIQSIITTYQKLLNKANGNSPDTTTDDPTLADYQVLRINLQPFSNLGANEGSNKLLLLNDILKNRNPGDINSVSKLDTLAGAVDKMIMMANDDTPPSALTTAELNAIGLTEVIDANIGAIRSAITASANDGSGIKTLSLLKTIQTAYLKVLTMADSIKANTTDASKTPTLSELQSLGIALGKIGNTGDGQQASALELFNDVIDGLNSSAVNTVAGLTAIATTIEKVMNVATATTKDAGSALGLTASMLNGLSFTTVTTDNLAQVTESIRLTQTADGKKLNTFKELQSAVDLGVIMHYAQSDLGTLGHVAPTLAQYQSAGVVTVDNGSNKAISISNVTAINSAVEALKADNVDTTSELQSLVNAYVKLLSMADNTKGNTTESLRMTVDDYKNIGALSNYVLPTGAIDGNVSSKAVIDNNPQKAASLKLLNDVIDAKSPTQVDAISEINAISILVDKLLDQASNSPSNTLTVTDFFSTQGASLGIQNVNDNNLSLVIQGLKDASDGKPDGSAIDTLAEIQNVVSLAFLKFYTDNPNASNSTPTQSIYTDLNLTEFANTNWNSNLVSGVNSVVNFLSASDISTEKVTSVAKAYQSILNEATGGSVNSNDNPTAGQYKEILKLPNATTPTFLFENASNDTTTNDKASNALSLLNDIIRQKNATTISTRNTIEDYAKVVDKLMNLVDAPDVKASTLSQTDLSNMGFRLNSGWASSNNTSPNENSGFTKTIVNFDDHGASIRTWAQIQDLIDKSSPF